MFRSRIKCGLRLRKMEGAARREDTIYYRCNSRTLVPGSATALAHPPQIHLRGDSVERDLKRNEQLRDRVAAAEVAMERLRRALDSTWDPDELRERYNAAASEKRAAEAQHLGELYASLRLVLAYHHVERGVDVEVDPMGERVEKSVRGGHALNHTPRP
ncbi:hypothetical protein [Kribbella sp. C-35]|uniref:hypothetical protein n=1 Tax=Kribbella sp. C-35 TaxID=2789276 RepID=UPI00397998BF